MKEERLQIGLFMDSFFPMVDGVCMVMDNYARAMKPYADVTVFVPSLPGKPFDDSTLPYKVERCRSWRMPVLDYSFPVPRFDRGFQKRLDRYQLDIVHLHSPFVMGLQGVRYARKHNIPVVATMHSQFKQDMQRAVRSRAAAGLLNRIPMRVFDRCDACWAVNGAIATLFYEDYGCKVKPGVLRNATNMLPVPDRAEARKTINVRCDLSDTEKVFLFVGRLNALKNIFFLVDAVKILKERAPFPFKLLFVGSGQDEHSLREKVKEAGMEKDVLLCGKVTDRELLAAFYARADLFLFPSYYDASSIVQIEAASQGTPTVFLEGAATASDVTDNVNGFVAKNDPAAYAARVEAILNDKALYASVCENAKRDLYVTWDEVIRDVLARYIEQIEKKKYTKEESH
ncbi:MAG: glycosyltransferase [Clostridia bacterium]|nr:glycosyltransferase [Clostridia bacterium]